MTTASGTASIKVERLEHRGWKNAVGMQNDTVRLIILADVGPRVLRYGLIDGPNAFHEVPDHAGLVGGDEFRSYGGHRFWVSPEVERTYYPDNHPVEFVRRESAVVLTAPVESTPPGTNLQKEIEIELDETGTHAAVTHRIANRGCEATELAPWALSVMAPGGRAILPLPSKAPFGKDRLQPEGVLSLWSYTDLSDPRWGFGKKYIQLKQDRQPQGEFKEQMAGIYNPHGWGAYYREGTLFVKRSEVKKNVKYPDFGCNFEVYTEPGFLELETLGPLQTLQPGEVCEHREDWWLFKDVPKGEGDAWIDRFILPIVATVS